MAPIHISNVNGYNNVDGVKDFIDNSNIFFVNGSRNYDINDYRQLIHEYSDNCYVSVIYVDNIVHNVFIRLYDHHNILSQTSIYLL